VRAIGGFRSRCLEVTDYQERPALDASSARRGAPGLEDLSMSIESGLNRRIDRVIRIISNKALVFGARPA